MGRNKQHKLVRCCCRNQVGPSILHTDTAINSFSLPGSFKRLPRGIFEKWVCVGLHLENSEPTMWFSQTMPGEHRPTSPPCRWSALITLRFLTKFKLVWRRLCDVVLFRSSCLFERTVTAFCTLPEYRLDRISNTRSKNKQKT